MIDKNKLIYCYFFLYLIVNTQPVLSDSTVQMVNREYPVPQHGLLVLQVPEPWNVTYYEPGDIKAPIIIFYPEEKPHAFQLTISPLWDDGYFRDITDPKYIKDYVESIGNNILEFSDQDTLDLRELNGKQGVGFYFQVSDESAPESEFKYLLEGAIAVDRLLLVFSYFSNQANDNNIQILLEMVQGAIQNHQRNVNLVNPETFKHLIS